MNELGKRNRTLHSFVIVFMFAFSLVSCAPTLPTEIQLATATQAAIATKQPSSWILGVGTPSGSAPAPEIDQMVLEQGGSIPEGIQSTRDFFEAVVRTATNVGTIDSCWNGGTADTLRINPFIKNSQGQFLWSAENEIYGEYPTNLSLNDQGLYYFNPNQELKAVPGSEKAICVYGGQVVLTDGTVTDFGEKPVLIRGETTLSDGRQAYLEYFDFKTGSWLSNPNVLQLILPEEFVSQVSSDTYSYDAVGLHITVAEGRVVDIPIDQINEKLQGKIFVLDLEQKSNSGYELGVVFREGQWRETFINFPFETNGENINNFPEIALEDVTSGRLAEAERLAAPAFPDTAKPFNQYAFDEKYKTVSAVISQAEADAYVASPATKSLRVPFFYKIKINGVRLIMPTVQVLNNDETERFIHMVEGEDFIRNRWDNYWIPFITLKYEPTFDMALDDDCNKSVAPFRSEVAAKNVVCPINAPQREYLEDSIQKTVTQGRVPEEWDNTIFYCLASGVWG